MRNSEIFYYSDFISYKEATPNSIYIDTRTLTDQYTTGSEFNFQFKVHHIDANLKDIILERSEYEVLINDNVVSEGFKFETKDKYQLKVKYKELVSEQYQISVVNPGNPYLYFGILGVCMVGVAIMLYFVRKKRNGA